MKTFFLLALLVALLGLAALAFLLIKRIQKFCELA